MKIFFFQSFRFILYSTCFFRAFLFQFLFSFTISLTLRDGLVAYYPFNASPNDESGNNNHGTERGAVSFVSDRYSRSGSAVGLAGDGYIEVQNGFPFNFIQNYTIAFWVKVGGTPGEYATYVHKGTSFLIQQNGAISSSISFQPAYVDGDSISTLATISNNAWVHVVAIKEGKLQSTYVNGIFSGTATAPNTNFINTAGKPLLFGARNTANTIPASGIGYYLTASLDDIFIYSRSLSSSEIVNLYNYEIPTSQPTKQPSSKPSSQPTMKPSSQPLSRPSALPSRQPSKQPTSKPSSQPLIQPTAQPSFQPTSNPSVNDFHYFECTKTVKSLLIPRQVDHMFVDMTGGAGGVFPGTYRLPGYGARVQANITVEGGTIIYITVGCQGTPQSKD
jgi:hypothetical protein